MGLNVVTLGPGRVLMADANPNTRAFYEKLGIACRVVQTDELHRAAGGIGCLTGVLERESAG
jgi:arginine deiminase